MSTTTTALAPLTTPVTEPTSTAAAVPLPRQPRLLSGLPVLRRVAGETQIGTRPRHAIVVIGVPEALASLLQRLDGRHTTDELMARAGPADAPTLREILTHLSGLGLLDDEADLVTLCTPTRLAADRTMWVLRSGRPNASLRRHREPAVVVVYGSGRIGVALATLLAASGVGWVHTVAEGVVQPGDTGTGYLGEDIGHARSDAAERAVRRISPETITGRPDPGRQPDLVVLTDAPVPDPRLAADLTAAGLPHLLVHAAEGTGVVGPLVLPGRTSCLHCVDLHNTDVDACWPALAAQLAAHPQPADLASTQATSAFGAAQALRFLHGCRGPTAGDAGLPVWSAAMEIDVFTGRSTRVEWRPHPRCPCGVARRTDQSGTVATVSPIPST
jgi:bacteriocin biosynthesis cyclodehydratase domain-containing protein